MEIGEGAASVTTPKDPPPDDGKKHVKIRFGVFFDGTLNNRTNINHRLRATENEKLLTAEEQKARAQLKIDADELKKSKEFYQKYGAPPSGEVDDIDRAKAINQTEGIPPPEENENSYEGFYTNVAKTEPYVEPAQGYQHTLTSYIEGSGTLNDAGDKQAGYAFAIWESGIRKKVEQGMHNFLTKILGKVTDQSEVIIDEIAIDVFGFSRGAAAARNFIYEILLHRDTALQLRLQDKGYTFLNANVVKVRFAGLYDTVSTYGLGVVVGAADNIEALKLYAVAHAEAALHLTSADEHRYHFSLTDILDCADANRKEYCLPGVHSDIGGGYRDAQAEKLILRGTPTAQGVLLHGNYLSPKEAERDRAQLIAAGWYQEDEIAVHRHPLGEDNELVTLSVVRPPIKNHYSRIPLQIMAKEARKQGIALTDKLDDDERVPDELNQVHEQLNNHVTGPSKPHAGHWIENREGWLLKLRHDYLHFSARMHVGHDPRIENGLRKRKIYPTRET